MGQINVNSAIEEGNSKIWKVYKIFHEKERLRILSQKCQLVPWKAIHCRCRSIHEKPLHRLPQQKVYTTGTGQLGAPHLVYFPVSPFMHIIMQWPSLRLTAWICASYMLSMEEVNCFLPPCVEVKLENIINIVSTLTKIQVNADPNKTLT